MAGALLKGAGLILAPLLLNPAYLSVDDFGSFALLMITAQLAIYLAGLGLASALLRFLTREQEADIAGSLPATAYLLAVGASVIVGFGFVFFAHPLGSALMDGGDTSALMTFLAVYVGSKCVASVPLAWLRVRERAARYTLAVVLEMIVLIVLVYLELAVNGTGLIGLIRAYALAGIVALIVLTVMMMREAAWSVDGRAASALLRYGVPLVLASLAGWFLNAGDRYLLNWLADRGAVAGYEWSARVAGLVNMLLVQSFQLAFTVVGLKALEAGAAGFYRRAFRHFIIWTGAAILVLSIWTPDGMRILMALFDIDPHYLQARTLVFPLALGFGAYGVYIIANNALLASGRTRIIGVNVLIVALLNAGLNIILIPYFGAMGAAVATTFSYAALAGLAVWTSRRDLSVRYPWRIPAGVTALLLVLFFAGLMVDPWPLLPRVASKLGLTLAYLVAIPVLGLYSREEIRSGWNQAALFLKSAKRRSRNP